MIVPANYENLQITHEGTLSKRAYYIPASSQRDDLVEHRESSDRFQLLNGDWKFKYYSNVHDLTEPFYALGFNTDDFDTIPVPSVWQNHGYDHHQYTNIRYPFPADPPYVPYENPCGCYVTKFNYVPDMDAPRAYLNFEGADSCLYAWLNGEYLGYNEVSHSTAEFDITDKVTEGENTLAVLVLKWCDGSYLEDQDKFRTSGIFRDVYILKRPQSHIRDYFVTNSMEGQEATLRIRFTFTEEVPPVSIKLLNADKKLVAKGSCKVYESGTNFTHQAFLRVKEPTLWNPEQPYLYTLVLETPNEVITDRWGFREIHIENNKVYLNGSSIKFRGVNRHDSDPVTGPVIPLWHMKRDLEMIKRFNFNAIRTSHYPNAPMFYQLCDQYGFMVIDEADHESHGAAEMYCSENELWENHVEHWNEPFADNPDFLEATLDRTKRCVIRDKNRPSVICWSMGNESAYGCCFEAALAWTKHFDPTRLTHYESAQYRSRKRKYDFSNIDLYSNMYPSIETLQEYVDSSPDKPYLMCEYSHAMGNGPGDLEDYWQFIQKNECMSGGFVWEWCDHAVYKGDAPNGKAMYWYGGDHGEYPHDGNFCVDGLVYPDRRPHTGVMEFKNVHRPVRVKAFDPETGIVTLHNFMDFVSVNSYLSIRYELNCDGAIIDSGSVDRVPAILPHAEGSIRLNIQVPAKGRSYLKLIYQLKHDEPLRPAGFLLGFDEIPLEASLDGRNQKALGIWAKKELSEDSLKVEDGERYLIVFSRDFTYRYDKTVGSFCSMVFKGRELLDKPISLNIWRAPTDNDRKLKLEWMAAHYDKAITRAYMTRTLAADSEVRIHSDVSIAAISVQRFMNIEVDWTVGINGAITVNILAKRNMEFPELPRFGLRLFVPESLEQVTYYGLGPTENYADKCHAVSHGIYSDTVEGLQEDYIRPQENGAHGGCNYVMLEDETLRITAVGLEPFSFNVSHFTQEELTAKCHNYELENCGSTVLCLDYRQNGIGSASCGPVLRREYALNEETIDFEIKIIPEIK